MAKKTKSTVAQDVTKVEVSLKDLKVMDKIYLTEDRKDRVEYTVLDVGDPFILIEDPLHFAFLYRVVLPIYKDVTNN